MSGRLILCGTPIGNLEDCSPRVVRVLGESDVIACEDTRHTRKLLSHFGIRTRELVSYHEGNERRRTRDLVDRVAAGATVAVVSDAGMPGVSDPGYHLVRGCLARDLPVEVVPGPSAAMTALVVSGLPPARFVFEGFLPRKSGERRRHLEALVEERRTLVFYESPHRVAACLEDLHAVLGDRPAALCRELTKLYEEVRRGTLAELLESVRKEGPRGEIVLVVGGAVHEHREAPGAPELAARARALMASGVPRKEALAEVAENAGVPKRAVFDALVETPES
ncbi:MAG TPA: 16S rRNA (cytidine(1402)-2'-O)-methyltransferase [Actinomycetota bacterium]|jgi:16S rRNA (cytidine1402-2'-O)-methyltransferase|nr:16S rRNA (cytidine(1402)-2'-O)-methyltransferase [Actinomycetota bacterium]